MKAKAAIVFMIVLLIPALPVSASETNKGAANMILDGATGATRLFRTAGSQDVIGDCTPYHNLFPKKTGGIAELMKQGELEKTGGEPLQGLSPGKDPCRGKNRPYKLCKMS